MKPIFRLVRGFSLVEIVIVLGVASFVLLALVGLTGTALNTTQESARNLEAASVASQLALRWSTMVEHNSDPDTTTATAAALPQNFPISIALPAINVEMPQDNILIDDAGLVTSVSAAQAFRLKYSLFRSSANPQMVRLYLCLSWPPQGASSLNNRSKYELVTATLLGPGA